MGGGAEAGRENIMGDIIVGLRFSVGCPCVVEGWCVAGRNMGGDCMWITLWVHLRVLHIMPWRLSIYKLFLT